MANSSELFDLVFEGGGAKGTVFVGALQEFERRGKKARRLVGTSAGAITATLMAAGYTSAEIEGLAKAKVDGKPVFSTFMDIPTLESFSPADIENSLTQRLFGAVDLPGIPEWFEKKIDRFLIKRLMKIAAYRELFSFVECGGLYAGARFRSWICEKLDAKQPGLGSTRLGRFHEETKCDLSLVACDTAGRRMLVLNHRTAPECPIDMAVRMSMSIPFVWQEVEWSEDWGTYLGEDLTGHTIVDGGALSNFPLELVISKDQDVLDVMGDTDPLGAGTIGLLIDELAEVPNSGSEEEEKEDPTAEGLMGDPQRLKTVKRVSRLVSTMMEAHDKQFIETYAKYVCRLPAKGYGTTEFGMTDERMSALIDAGRTAMKEYLDKLEA